MFNNNNNYKCSIVQMFAGLVMIIHVRLVLSELFYILHWMKFAMCINIEFYITFSCRVSVGKMITRVVGLFNLIYVRFSCSFFYLISMEAQYRYTVQHAIPVWCFLTASCCTSMFICMFVYRSAFHKKNRNHPHKSRAFDVPIHVLRWDNLNCVCVICDVTLHLL